MLRKVAKYIGEQKLLQDGAKVLTTLSGGADSVALLLILRRLGYNCHAIHCNFHLRGEESMRDEKFVRDLCSRIKIPLTVVDFDTTDYAKSHGISIEMAAREQRYAAFEKEREAIAAEAIAVAHHRDDSTETVLLNLIRGTGIRGLHGIRPKNGKIIRPLLAVGRKEIISYLEKINEPFVTDSTNLKSDFTRNKIRLELIPLMQQINPSVAESIAATAERLAEAEEIFNRAILESISRVKSGESIDIPKLMDESSPKTILHEILSPFGFNSTQCADIFASLQSEGSKRFTSGEWFVIKERDKLFITNEKRREHKSCILPANGTVETDSGILEIRSIPFDGIIPKHKECATLDADLLQMPLTLRQIERGDRFIPFGMRGSKLVSDYLTDCKRTILEKERQLVITDSNNNIVWLVGERPAAPYCINKKSVNALYLKWEER